MLENKTRFFSVVIFVLISVLLSCEQDQSQNQTITLSEDQFGSVSGSIYIRFPGGGVIPYSAMKEGRKIQCVFVEDTYKHECNGQYNDFETELRIRYSYKGNNSDLIDACRSNPLCQYEGIDTPDFDGTYSFSNLLIGGYEVKVEAPLNGKESKFVDSECFIIEDDGSKRSIGSDSLRFNVYQTSFYQTVGSETVADITLTAVYVWSNKPTIRCEVIE
ncbi:MAG: hypothetical protein PHN19_01610 [Patescibacteria group bacterium]|nr:hypothetical protein [Patescibacteria group bacterium]